MKNLLLAVTLVTPVVAWAQPSSQVAWTPEELNFIKSADSSKGEKLASNCINCHGQEGISSMPNTPSLAGQLPTYLYKQLRDYTNEDRSHSMMPAIAKTINKEESAAIAIWFSKQQKKQGETSEKTFEIAKNLVENGDSQRTLPPCEVCHGSNGQGSKFAIPVLAGQRADYLSTTLKLFKEGNRHNDVYSRMRTIAELLDEKEINELGLYYQQMK